MKKVIYIGFNCSVFTSQVIELLKQNAKNGFKVFLISNYPKNIKLKEMKQYVIKKYPDYPFIDKLTYRQLIPIFKEIGVDTTTTTIHIRNDINGIHVYNLIKKMRPNFNNILVDVRGAVFEEIKYFSDINFIPKKIKLLYYKYLRKRYRKIQYWSVVSEEMKKYIQKIAGNRNDFNINHSLAGKQFVYDKESRLEIRKKLRIAEDEIIILFSSGGSGKWQNVDDMISFFSKFDSNVKFLLLTNKKYKKAKNIINLSVKYDEMYKYLSASDIAIILRDENIVNKVASPVKFSEYICCGLPVIANRNVALINEFITTTGTGKLISDINEIKTNLLKELLKLDRNEISKKGIALFSVQKTAKNYTHIYESILSKGSSIENFN